MNQSKARQGLRSRNQADRLKPVAIGSDTPAATAGQVALLEEAPRRGGGGPCLRAGAKVVQSATTFAAAFEGLQTRFGDEEVVARVRTYPCDL
jgi:hypothetical protein